MLIFLNSAPHCTDGYAEEQKDAFFFLLKSCLSFNLLSRNMPITLLLGRMRQGYHKFERGQLGELKETALKGGGRMLGFSSTPSAFHS